MKTFLNVMVIRFMSSYTVLLIRDNLSSLENFAVNKNTCGQLVLTQKCLCILKSLRTCFKMQFGKLFCIRMKGFGETLHNA